ncbi:MAG TPA: DUF3159 domain-containing protein [Baekduia sp.]|nr:DUF3159 domain-containing protein [Baekduia sp.]
MTAAEEPGPQRSPGSQDPEGPRGDHAGLEELSEALGGKTGIAESSLPAGAFAVAYAASGSELELSAGIALGVGGVLTLLRLHRRETLQYALAGLFGVALAAFVATRTGRAEDFYLPGLLLNAGYAAGYAISIAVRYPLIGVLLGAVSGEGLKWRKDPHRVRAYSRASWIFVAVFSLRLAVQLPLYLAGEVVVLGVARVAMGLPLFVAGLWLCYLSLRRDRVL